MLFSMPSPTNRTPPNECYRRSPLSAKLRLSLPICVLSAALGFTSVAGAASPTISQLAKRTGLSQTAVRQAESSLQRGLSTMRRQVKVVWKHGRPTLRGPARYIHRRALLKVQLLPSSARHSPNAATASSSGPQPLQTSCSAGTETNFGPAPQGYPWFNADMGYIAWCEDPHPQIPILVAARVSCADGGSLACYAYPFSKPAQLIGGSLDVTYPNNSDTLTVAETTARWTINGGNQSGLWCSGSGVCDVYSSGAFLLVAGGSVAVAPRGYYFNPYYPYSGKVVDPGCAITHLGTWIQCLGVNGEVVRVEAGVTYGLRDYPWFAGDFNTAGTG